MSSNIISSGVGFGNVVIVPINYSVYEHNLTIFVYNCSQYLFFRHGKLFEVRYRLFSRREEVLFQIINNFTGATLNVLNVMVYNGDDEFINLRFENDEYSYPFQIEEGTLIIIFYKKNTK